MLKKWFPNKKKIFFFFFSCRADSPPLRETKTKTKTKTNSNIKKKMSLEIALQLRTVISTEIKLPLNRFIITDLESKEKQ